MRPEDLLRGSDLSPEQVADWTKSYATKPEQMYAENRAVPPPPGPTPQQLAQFDAPVHARKNEFKDLEASFKPFSPPGSAHSGAGSPPEDLAKNNANAIFATPKASPAGEGPALQDFARPQLGGGVATKAGFQNESRATSTVKGVEASPEVAEQQGLADAAGRGAAVAGRDAGIIKANAEMAYLDRHQQLQADHIKQAEQRQKEHAAAFDGEMKKLREVRDEVASGRIDPDQYWERKDSGSKAAIAISVMLGAISQSLSGGPNPGLAMLNGAIERDIDAQKANLGAKKNGLEAQRNLLGDMRLQFGDEAQAENATWGLYLDKAKTGLESEMAKAKDPEVKGNYLKAIQQIEQDKATRDERFYMAAQDKVTSQMHEKYRPASSGVGGPNEHEIILEGNHRFNNPNWEPGLTGRAREQEAYRSARLSFTGRDIASGEHSSVVRPGKGEQTELQKKAEEAKQELGGLIQSFSNKKFLEGAAAGTTAGAAYAHAPGWLPGVSGARRGVANREQYNAELQPALGAAWRWRTGGMEPKNEAILKEQAAPYLLLEDDPPDVVALKNKNLLSYLNRAAASRGVAGKPEIDIKKAGEK